MFLQLVNFSRLGEECTYSGKQFFNLVDTNSTLFAAVESVIPGIIPLVWPATPSNEWQCDY